MRFLVIYFFLIVVGSTINAQVPSKLKYDELIYSYDSTTVLIRKGSMNSVYNLKSKSYVIAPTKCVLINFPKSNLYAEVKPELDILSIYFLVNENVMQVFGSLDSCYVAMASTTEGEYFYNYNGEFFEQEIDGELLSQSENDLKWTKFEIIKCDEGNYILNHYEPEIYFGDGNSGVFVQSHCASGIFNTILKTWLILPRYKTCYHISGYIFCLDENYILRNGRDDMSSNSPFIYTYDLFKLEDNSAKKLLNKVSTIETDLLANILNVDTLEICEDQSHYITEKNGKEGFIQFHLFNPVRPEQADFMYKEILKPTADFVMFSDIYGELIVVAGDTLSHYHLATREDIYYQSEEFLATLSDSLKSLNYSFIEGTTTTGFFMLNKIDEIYTYQNSKKKRIGNENFGVEKINDSIIIVTNFTPMEENYNALQSIFYPGEDSMDHNGNTVYLLKAPGNYKSGVYNLNTRSWLMQPSAKAVYSTGAGFLMENPDGNLSPLRKETWHYSFVDFYGNEIFSRINADDLFGNLELLKYCFPEFHADSLFEARTRSFYHTLLRNRKNEITYYAVTDAGLGLFEPLYREGSYYLYFYEEPQEFIHLNRHEEFKFWLAGDSIFVEIDSIRKAVHRNNGKIYLASKSCRCDDYDEYGLLINNYKYGCEILLINGTDTNVFSNLPIADSYELLFDASIEVNDDILVINDLDRTDISCVECSDDQNRWYGTNGEMESENSSVWKKTNGQWKKVSPYYAAISAIPNGYIARTGYFEETYSYYEGRESELKSLSRGVIESRYFLLDSNFKAIPYLDYFDFPLIEDLGFGLKVCIDNADCFFMTYNRVAVTNAEWDDFELYNKKLKAIKNEVPSLDEDGVPMFDEFGAPINISESVIMFFKIP